MRIVILGLSITSSWGNGHATTYRGLVRQLAARGHQITFLERDTAWYAAHRDMLQPPGARTRLYGSLDELQRLHERSVRTADLAIVGSFVPEGVAVGEWVTRTATGVTAFYDIDTPITLARLAGAAEYLVPELVPCYDLYLSFTGGPTLARLEREFGAKRAVAFYCSADPHEYYPEVTAVRWDLGYLGTYSDDRQPSVDALILEPARTCPDIRCVVAGAQYPQSIAWPAHVEHVSHVPPGAHRTFYCAQRFTLNVTRAEMIRAGWSPSVRLFEAAACGTPIISDSWEGLDEFFEPGVDILIADSARDVARYLTKLPETERMAIGQRGRGRVLARHTPAHRAAELEALVLEVRAGARTQR